jgi:DNA-binding IclR family transcriptional regulator
MATSANGRAGLAGRAPDRREAAGAGLAQHNGARWPAMRGKLDRALRDYHKRGFCFAHAEWDLTVSGVAAPVPLGDGAEALALNIGGSSKRLSPEILEDNLGPRIRELADTLAERLWQPRARGA